MFGTLKKNACPIGMDLGRDYLTLAQLAHDGPEPVLVAGCRTRRPADVAPGTPHWQRWAIEAVRGLTSHGGFCGKGMATALPAGEIFVDCLKRPTQTAGKMDEAIFSAIKRKLPFEPICRNTVIRCLPTEQDNLLVLAAERTVVDRYLAIYERTGLTVRSIGVWPVALANCYATLFGKREGDRDAVVMLLDFQPDRTNLVIARCQNPLYACSIPLGTAELKNGTLTDRLLVELTACRNLFVSLYASVRIERLIVLSGPALDSKVYQRVAAQLDLRAQLADCLTATEREDGNPHCPDRRKDNDVSWALAFGLGL
jgi:Tfp pilus assembly PilM family ATPase